MRHHGQAFAGKCPAGLRRPVLTLPQALAPKHLNTLFLRTSVENAPFLVNRLGVKVLPCVISFVDGNAVDR